MTFLTLRSLFLSLLLHGIAIGLLIISIDLAPKPVQPRAMKSVINAVTVDSKQIEAELTRFKEADRKKEDQQKQKQQELEKKLKDLQDKTSKVEVERKTEEKRLQDLKKKQSEEEKKLTDTKKQKEELERKHKEEELDKKKKEEDKKKAEAEKKRKEEEKKRKDAETALKKQLDDEQNAEDQTVVDQYIGRISSAISQEFNLVGLPPGLSCVFFIRMIRGGEVVEARITKSSGNPIFDRRAEVALNKASPLPVPDDPRIFDKLREINFTFDPAQ